ncbi:MAG: transglycosylase family protein [Solirubrobacteraceae bacterium MAG38_C4-C5]|nr:transglycosylase family protein [Candidatus Siliceabacter maunaloa]
MHSKRILGACLAGAVLAPAAPALAQDGDERLRPVLANAITGADGVTAQAADAAHKRLVRRHMTVARRYADLKYIALDEPALGAAHMANTGREVREATQGLRAKNETLREERRERREERRVAEREGGASATGAAAGSGSGSNGSGADASGSGGAPSGTLQSIAQCESGGDPGAVGGGGAYGGKYQFDRQTWGSVGGSGDPAAAPESEQDSRAQKLLQERGTSPWPTCG